MVGVGIVEMIGLAALVGAAAFVLIRSLGRRKRNADSWVREMGVQLTARSEALIASYIGRTRAFRIAGALIGFVSPIAYAANRQEALPEPYGNSLVVALVGYLVGAVMAEVTFTRPRPRRATATLAPRELHQYLPSAMSRALRVGALITLALVPLYLLVPTRQPRLEVGQLLGWGLLPVLVAVGVEMLQRYIVRRPQPLGDRDLVAADDAIRSASVHALAGAGIALELLLIGAALNAIGFTTDVQLLRWTLPWLALICMGAAIGAWTDLTKPHRWQVHRTGLQAQR